MLELGLHSGNTREREKERDREKKKKKKKLHPYRDVGY